MRADFLEEAKELRAEQGQKEKILLDAKTWLEHRQNLLKLSEISIILDTYDDIFSDFDPRHFSQRTISDDFLLEIKKASREKTSGIIELKFLIPKIVRHPTEETLIKKRLKEYFRKQHDMVHQEITNIRKKGGLMVLGGVLIGIIAAVILPEIGVHSNSLLFQGNVWEWFISILPNILLIILEPASWFLIWEGINRLTETWKERKLDLEFFEKMVKCEITFIEY